MDSKTNVPSFTVSLRGYDRVEVDEYLDSLADALGQVEDAQEQNRRLQTHIGRLNGRIKDLEDRINADTPKTGAIIGERIGILLRTAEETAADTVQRAEARAVEMVTEAEQRVTDSQETARVTVAGGQEQARRIEASARAEAAEIISEAEARAAARTRQIEQWAEQVVSHTRAEEARMLREQQEKRNAALAELAALREQRDGVAATLAALRETLGQALGLVVPPVHPAPPAELAQTAGAGAAADADAAGSDGLPFGTALELHAGEPGAAPAADAGAGAESGAGAHGDHAGTDALETHGADQSEADEPETGAEADADADADAEDQAEAGAAGHNGFAAAPPAPGIAEAGGSAEETSHRAPFDGEAFDSGAEGSEAPEPVTSEVEVVRIQDAGIDSQDDEFEAKLEAWVSEGAKHFRRM